MTYHYKGKEIGNRPAAVNFIITLHKHAHFPGQVLCLGILP